MNTPAASKGRPRAFNKDSALDIALKIFWRHGYEGTSVAMLAQAMRINPPSLYAAFGNKEQLFAQAVARYRARYTQAHEEALSRKSAKKIARSLLEAEVALVTHPKVPTGNLLVHGALATGQEGESVQAMLAGIRKAEEKKLVKRLRVLQKEGKLADDIDPAALAGYLSVLMAGLAVQARCGASRAQLLKTVEMALQRWPK